MPWSRLLLLLLAVSALACGEDSTPEKPAAKQAEPSGEVRPTPDDGGVKPMEPGEYRSSKFRPEVSFTIDRRYWQKEFETAESLSLWDQEPANGGDYEEEGTIHVLRPYGLFDRKDPSDRRGKKWPRDLARWLREDSGLEVTGSRKAEVAGFPAEVLDARAPDKDLRVFLDSEYQEYFVPVDWLLRLYVLDAGDEQRVIALRVSDKTGPKGFEALERVVRTIKFSS
jgi:hypothetical protein